MPSGTDFSRDLMKMRTRRTSSPLRQQSNQITIPIEGMTCAACVQTVRESLERVSGVHTASVNLATETASIIYNGTTVTTQNLVHAVRSVGYDAGTDQLSLIVPDLGDATSMATIEKKLLQLDGVTSVTTNLSIERVFINHIRGSINQTVIVQTVESTGYKVESIEHSNTVLADLERFSRKEEIRTLRLKFLIAITGSILVMLMMFLPFLKGIFGTLGLNLLAMFIATPIQFWAGRQFYIGGWFALKHGKTNMNSLIAIGTFAAYIYSVILTFSGMFSSQVTETYFDTSSTIIALVLLGRYLESQAKVRTSGAIRKLMTLAPETARIIRDGREVDVSVSDVSRDDTVIIRPGDRIPIDGTIIEGDSEVDESMMTGEFSLTYKKLGSQVFAGTLNIDGSCTVKVTGNGRQTALFRIIEMVQQAQGSRAPVQSLADTVASYFVPLILSIATVVFGIWLAFGPDPSYQFALMNMIAVLIIACPCALGLATPTAIMVGIGKGAEKGILIRDATSLETADKLDIIVFDKTGTLTQGTPTLTDIIVLDGTSEEEVLRLASSVNRSSNHPIASGINEAAISRGVKHRPSEHFQSAPGLGVRAQVEGEWITVGSIALAEQAGISIKKVDSITSKLARSGKTPIAVIRDHEIIAILGMGDKLRADSLQTVKRLNSMGIEVIMLTGDTAATAEAVAKQAGISWVVAEVMPNQKAHQIEALQAKGKKVGMVGDGINDAPALAKADVGIAIGTGTDVALEAADVALMHPELHGVTEMIALSKSTIKAVRQNLFWAFFYNISLIPLAAGVLYIFFKSTGVPLELQWALGEFGFLNPVLAALAMAFSSVTVVLNSLRLHHSHAR